MKARFRIHKSKSLFTTAPMPPQIKLLALSLSLLIVSPSFAALNKITGRTASGTSFEIEENSVSSPPNPDGNWGFMELTFKTEGKNSVVKYKIPIQSPVKIKSNPIGFISISEKTGGMNGVYRVTYLNAANTGLEIIAGIDSTLENGKFSSAESFYPKWTKQINTDEKSILVKSIARNREQLRGKTNDLTIDNALLLLANPEFSDEIKKQDPLFFENYSDDINTNVDSSIANLIRRKMLITGISLCDSVQFDVFACKLEIKTLSICLGEKNGSSTIQYRVGSKDKIELLLEKPTPNNLADTVGSESFSSGRYLYTVRFGNRNQEGNWNGVVILKDNRPIATQQCQPGAIEPFRLPKM